MITTLLSNALNISKRVLNARRSRNIFLVTVVSVFLLFALSFHYNGQLSRSAPSDLSFQPGISGGRRVVNGEYFTADNKQQGEEGFKVVGVSPEHYNDLKVNQGAISEEEGDPLHPVPNVIVSNVDAPLDGENNDTDATAASEGYTKEESRVFHIKDMAYDATYRTYPDYNNPERQQQHLSQNPVFRDFINDELFKLIKASDPQLGGLNNDDHYHEARRIPMLNGKLRENNVRDPIRSKNYLSKFFKLTTGEQRIMSESHENFVKNMPADYPEEIQEQIKGDGILYCGGGKYNWLVLVSLKQLRSTGSRLPVEVFIPNDEEYSYDLCNRVFPSLGAKCIMMADYLDAHFMTELKGYQLKSMALLLTSFENVLMLDADNFPLRNPDFMFFNEPFKSHNLVLWPDIWRRSTSPLYYDIAGVKVNETKLVRRSYYDERDHPEGIEHFTVKDYNERISYHDLEGTFPEASSETGQVLINKKTHVKSIFLGLYYNYYGPGYYYPMFSQGQAGEGDKETILASAHYFNLPYYQVEEFIREFGFPVRGTEDNGFEDVDFHILAMAQYDPIIDFIQSSDYKTFQSGFPYEATKNNYYKHKFANSQVMFLHTNIPKLYPWQLLGQNYFNVHDDNWNPRRLYSKVLVNELGYDAELRVWDTMRSIICENQDFRIPGLTVEKMVEVCPQMEKHVEFLRKDTKYTVLDEESIKKGITYKHMKPTSWN